MTSFLARHAFPLAIALVAGAFLGLFFLYPLLNVFGASVLDPTGTTLTLCELRERAFEPLLPAGPR